MKKELFAAITLILMLIIALVNIHFLDKLTNGVAELAQETERAALSGDWDAARKSAEAAHKKWEDSCGYTHLVLRHTEIEAAGDTLTELLREVYSENPGGVRGASVAAVSRMNCIASIEHIRLGSVF